MARKYTKKAGVKYGRPHAISAQQRAQMLQEALENKEFIWHDRFIRMDKIAKALCLKESSLNYALREYLGIRSPRSYSLNGLRLLFLEPKG